MNLLYKIWVSFGIFKKRRMPPLDPAKVQAKLNQLNVRGQAGAPHWVASDGIYAVTKINIQNGQPVFDPNTGVPLILFVNTQTGETRIFDARAFTVTPLATPPGTTR